MAAIRSAKRFVSGRMALAAGALVVLGCAPATPRVLNVAVPHSLQEAPRPHADLATTTRAIASVLAHRFGLPLSPTIPVYLYASAEQLANGLVVDGGMSDSGAAREMASSSIGVGTPAGIFLRTDRLEVTPRSGQISVIAHELTHAVQWEAARGRRAGEQWIREGYADWVAARVLEHYGMRTMASMRMQAQRGLARLMLGENVPSLELLRTNRQWMAARRQYGLDATYRQAFLAVDRLIARAGEPAVLDYFRRFAVDQDRDRIFREAFGVTREDFEADVRDSFARELGIH